MPDSRLISDPPLDRIPVIGKDLCQRSSPAAAANHSKTHAGLIFIPLEQFVFRDDLDPHPAFHGFANHAVGSGNHLFTLL
jgi:hypothetical protein